MLLTAFLIGIGAGATASQPAEPAPGLAPEWLYHGIGRPVMVRAASPRSFGTVTLVLMDVSIWRKSCRTSAACAGRPIFR